MIASTTILHIIKMITSHRRAIVESKQQIMIDDPPLTESLFHNDNARDHRCIEDRRAKSVIRPA